MRVLRTSILMCVALGLCGCGAAASYGGSTTPTAEHAAPSWQSMGAPATPAATISASGDTTPAPPPPVSGGGAGGEMRAMEAQAVSLDSAMGGRSGGFF